MSHPVQTLADVAFRVSGILRKFGPETFEQMLFAWAAEVNKPLAEFEEARRKHLLKALSESRLCDEAAGPPGDDWEWHSLGQVEIDGKRQNLPAWFPPELGEKNWPVPEYPLPIPDNRELNLPEMYAARVAIHALHAKRAKLEPWTNRPSPMFDEDYWKSRLCPADCKDSLAGWILFQGLLRYARETPETDVKWLRGILLRGRGSEGESEDQQISTSGSRSRIPNCRRCGENPSRACKPCRSVRVDSRGKGIASGTRELLDH